MRPIRTAILKNSHLGRNCLHRIHLLLDTGISAIRSFNEPAMKSLGSS